MEKTVAERIQTIRGYLNDLRKLSDEFLSLARHSGTDDLLFFKLKQIRKSHDEFEEHLNTFEKKITDNPSDAHLLPALRNELVNVCRVRVLSIAPDRVPEFVRICLENIGHQTVYKTFAQEKDIRVNDIVVWHKYKQQIVMVDWTYRPKKYNYELPKKKNIVGVKI